ncbi:MAG: hypothetical protein A2V70_19140 [Planctomycetes bacterium RBG_13_63_9]|nr:MAG: hypothetical protein A2V70_19140 [Planctomycetes bacterium RBG_13_63_9]
MNAENGRLLQSCLLSQIQMVQLVDLQLATMQKMIRDLRRADLLMPPEETMEVELRILRDEAKNLSDRLQNRVDQLRTFFR